MCILKIYVYIRIQIYFYIIVTKATLLELKGHCLVTVTGMHWDPLAPAKRKHTSNWPRRSRKGTLYQFPSPVKTSFSLAASLAFCPNAHPQTLGSGLCGGA